MTNILQATFWVPKPSDDFSWQWAPEVSNTLRLMTEGGVVKAPRYSRFLVLDDPAFWQGMPIESYVGFNNLNFKMFGAPGQVLQKNWSNQIRLQDDPPMWQGAPTGANNINARLGPYLETLVQNTEVWELLLDDPPQWQNYSVRAWPIQALTGQKFFGFAGQVPTKNFNSVTTQDDSSTWQQDISNLSSLTIPFFTKNGFFGQGGQVVQFKPNFTYDEAASWNWLPTREGANATMNFYPPPLNPNAVKPSFIVPRPDDVNREFQAQPLAAKVLNLVGGTPLGSPIYVPTGGDDYSARWYGQSTGRNVSLNKTQGPKPYNIYPWRWDDDASIWQGKPSYSVIQYDLATQVTFPPFYSQTGGDDSSTWRAEPHVNRSAFPPISQVKVYGQNGQAYPYQWKWTQNDDTPWQPPSLTLSARTNTISQQPASIIPSAILWSPDDPDEMALWSGSGVQTNNNVVQIKPTPFTLAMGGYPRGIWRFDDPSGWDGKPVSNASIYRLNLTKMYGQPGQVPPFRPNFTQDDPPVWFQQTPLRDQILLTTQIIYPPNQTVGLRPLLWRQAPFNYDVAESQWYAKPVGSPYGFNVPKPYVPIVTPYQYRLWQTTYDTAESQWNAEPLSSYQALAPRYQPIYCPIYALTGGDDYSARWYGQPVGKNVPLVGVQGPKPKSVYPWQWSDDQSGWQWNPLYPVMQSILTIAPTLGPFYAFSGSDDNVLVKIPSVNSVLGTLITQAQFYGQPGQGYPYRPSFWLDDIAQWQPDLLTLAKPSTLTLVQPTAVMPASILWSPDDPDDAAVLLGNISPANNKLLSLPVVPSFPSGQYPRGVFRFDDASEWIGRPITDRTLFGLLAPKLFGQPGQGVTFRANFTLDDPPMFQGSPVLARALQLNSYPQFYAGGEVLVKVWSPIYTQDDASTWNPVQYPPLIAIQTKVIYPPGTTVAGLVSLHWGAAPFNYDVGEAPGWVGKPVGQDYQMTQPGIPNPLAGLEFTVSGQGVALTFQEFFSGVSYTDAPIPKRTD